MIDTYLVSVDGRTHSVVLEDGADGKLRAVVDGRARELDARALEGGAWSLLEGTAARLVRVDGTLPKLSIEVGHPEGEPRRCSIEIADGRAAAGTAGARPLGPAAALTLRAPIPGKLVKVLVKAGDAVKAGQALLMLEAMKMENELRAPRDGVVAALHVSEGTAVETGQELISLS